MSALSFFEKAISTSSHTVSDLDRQIEKIFNGTRQYTQQQLKEKSPAERLADIGVIGSIDAIAGVDVCQVLSYSFEILMNKSGYVFDPVNPPNNPPTTPEAGPLTIKAWLLQSRAYSIKKKIDSFNAANGERVNIKDLTILLGELVNELTDLLNPKKTGSLADPILQQNFYKLIIASNFLDVALTFLQSYVQTQGNVENLAAQIDPNAAGGISGAQRFQGRVYKDYKKITDFLNNINRICGTVLSLDIYNPSGAFVGAALAAASTFVNKQIQDYINKLNSIIGEDLQKLVPFLENLQNQCTAIQKYCQSLLKTIRQIQVYVRIGVVIMKILTTIIEFLKKLPIPNQFTVVGINVTFADTLAKMQKFVDRITDDINAINSFIKKIISTISHISSDIQKINNALTILITNLKSCSSAPQDLVDKLKDTQSTLNDTFAQLDNFVQNSEKKKSNNNLTYGGFTIQIITEEIVKGSAGIPRRYGVAIDSNGVEVVKSTPTFATLDSIIISDVKLLLESNNLVNTQASALSLSQQNTIEESLSYLEDNNINSNFSTNFPDNSDSANNHDENSGLGLNAFMNNKKGGKDLRARMRASMAASSTQLQKNLAAANQR
jgi:hypothetical protein